MIFEIKRVVLGCSCARAKNPDPQTKDLTCTGQQHRMNLEVLFQNPTDGVFAQMAFWISKYNFCLAGNQNLVMHAIMNDPGLPDPRIFLFLTQYFQNQQGQNKGLVFALAHEQAISPCDRRKNSGNCCQKFHEGHLCKQLRMCLIFDLLDFRLKNGCCWYTLLHGH